MPQPKLCYKIFCPLHFRLLSHENSGIIISDDIQEGTRMINSEKFTKKSIKIVEAAVAATTTAVTAATMAADADAELNE